MSGGKKFDSGKPELVYLGKTDTWWFEDKYNLQYSVSKCLDNFWFDNQPEALLTALKFFTSAHPDYLQNVMEVLKFGASKYGLLNYRLGMRWSRLVSAARRHLYWYPHVKKELIDSETQVNHDFNAYCCIQFLYEYATDKIGEDDRHGFKRDQDRSSFPEPKL
jgi:hypothetical protein